jgi:hypothetical protein
VKLRSAGQALVQCLYLYWYLIASAKYSTSTVLGSLSDWKQGLPMRYTLCWLEVDFEVYGMLIAEPATPSPAENTVGDRSAVSVAGI